MYKSSSVTIVMAISDLHEEIINNLDLKTLNSWVLVSKVSHSSACNRLFTELVKHFNTGEIDSCQVFNSIGVNLHRMVAHLFKEMFFIDRMIIIDSVLCLSNDKVENMLILLCDWNRCRSCKEFIKDAYNIEELGLFATVLHNYKEHDVVKWICDEYKLYAMNMEFEFERRNIEVRLMWNNELVNNWVCNSSCVKNKEQPEPFKFRI